MEDKKLPVIVITAKQIEIEKIELLPGCKSGVKVGKKNIFDLYGPIEKGVSVFVYRYKEDSRTGEQVRRVNKKTSIVCFLELEDETKDDVFVITTKTSRYKVTIIKK